MLTLSSQNFLDGKDEKYIAAWTMSAKSASRKVWNYDQQVIRRGELEKTLEMVLPKLHNPINLPFNALKEIHDFLDEYNYILDKEFGTVKAILYPNYWKIGIGVIKYEFNSVEFILFPVEYGKSHLLIKEVEPGYDWQKEMSEDNVLMWGTMKNGKALIHPSFSYDLLEDKILNIARTYNFPINDLFLANEYLTSFIDRYNLYLNVGEDQDGYSLAHIKYMLNTVIPMIVGTQQGFAEWVKEYSYDLESYNKSESREYIQKEIHEAEKRIKENFMSPVRVKVVSNLYDIQLINFFISFLESKGIISTKRQYLFHQKGDSMYGVLPFKNWNRLVLWQNVQSFFANFYRLYKEYIEIHFSRLTEYLEIVESNEMTIIHILVLENHKQSPPYLEVYHLKPSRPEMGKILFYREQEEICPVNRKEFFKNNRWDCKIDGITYEIVLMQVQMLDFMFSNSPAYTLIKEKLMDRLTKLFTKRKRTPDDDKIVI